LQQVRAKLPIPVTDPTNPPKKVVVLGKKPIGCGGPGEPACKGGGGGIGNGNCGHPGQPACKVGGVERCTTGVIKPGQICPGDGTGAHPDKIIVIDHYQNRYVPVYQNRYIIEREPNRATAVVSPVVSVPPATAPCLTKEYLQTGLVLFRDICSKEWAVSATSVEKPVTTTTARRCLTKENLANDTILFKDVCTGEMAMNPPAKEDDKSQAP